MSKTPLLSLPFIMPGQAMKHVTHNEAIMRLDSLVHLAVKTRTQDSPPSEPNSGERYLIPMGATAAWAEQENHIAVYDGYAWTFLKPQTGWICWDISAQQLLVFSGGEWTLTATGRTSSQVLEFGVNTAADTHNRLAVKSNSVLLSHDDTAPGTGSVQLVINKQDSSKTAAQLYQSAYAGRAETGLTGDDDFHIKVSPDGENWKEALVIDRNSASVSFPNTQPITYPVNLFNDAGRFSGTPEPTSFQAPNFTAPQYLTPYNGASFGAGPKYTSNSQSYGGSAAALDPTIVSLIDRIKSPGNSRRFGVEFFALRITSGTGTSAGAAIIENENYYRCVENRTAPITAQLTMNYHVIVLTGKVGLTQSPRETLYLDGEKVIDPQKLTPNDGWKQITRIFDFDSRSFSGYSQVLVGLMATPNTAFLLACPFVSAGHCEVAAEKLYGIIPSVRSWG